MNINSNSEGGNIVNEKIYEVKHEVDYKINETKKKIDDLAREVMQQNQDPPKKK